MLLLAIPPIVYATFWFSSPIPVFEQNQLAIFASEVKHVRTMEDIPWPAPLWMKRLDSLQVPQEMRSLGNLWDTELQESLNYLASSPALSGEKCNEYLQEKAKKIASLLGRDSDYVGLSDYAKRLAENSRTYHPWATDHGVETLDPAVLLGIAWSRASNYQVPLSHFKALLEGQSIRSGDGMSMALEIGSLLDTLLLHGIEIEKGKNMVQRLHNIAVTSGLQTEALKSLVTMIPIGQRFAIGTTSKAKYSAIVDLIKAENGLAYGIRYATSDALHGPTIAFVMSHAQLPKLIEFFHGDFNFDHDIEYVQANIKWKTVEVNWYPLGPINSPQAMIFQYAVGGHATKKHLFMGMLISYCKQLEEATSSTQTAEFLELRADMLKLIAMISRIDAQMVLNVVSSTCKGNCGTKETSSIMAELISLLQKPQIVVLGFD